MCISCYSENSSYVLDNPITSVQINFRVLAQDCDENIY